jgi:GNAT superfamily N-acetyltransferase
MNPADRAAETVVVRPAEARDAEGAVEVLRRSITELCALDHQEDADTLAAWLANKTPPHFLAWLADGDSFCAVAEADGRIAGVGLLHRSGEVRLCYLMPGRQGRGIGRAVYLALENRAKDWGLETLRLESTSAARGFYERLGFRPAGSATPGFGISHCHPYEKRLLGRPSLRVDIRQ